MKYDKRDNVINFFNCKAIFVYNIDFYDIVIDVINDIINKINKINKIVIEIIKENEKKICC